MTGTRIFATTAIIATARIAWAGISTAAIARVNDIVAFSLQIPVLAVGLLQLIIIDTNDRCRTKLEFRVTCTANLNNLNAVGCAIASKGTGPTIVANTDHASTIRITSHNDLIGFTRSTTLIEFGVENERTTIHIKCGCGQRFVGIGSVELNRTVIGKQTNIRRTGHKPIGSTIHSNCRHTLGCTKPPAVIRQ